MRGARAFLARANVEDDGSLPTGTVCGRHPKGDAVRRDKMAAPAVLILQEDAEIIRWRR